MSATDIESVGNPLPQIGRLLAQPPASLVVTWATGRRAGQTETIDIAPIVNTYKIFRALRKDNALFQAARVIDDGNTVAWDDGDLQLSAATIEKIAETCR